MRRWGLLLAGGLTAAVLVVALPHDGPGQAGEAVVHRYDVEVSAELLGPLADVVRVDVDDEHGDADVVFLADRRVDLGVLSLDAAVTGREGTLVMGGGEPAWDGVDGGVTWQRVDHAPVVLDEHFAHVAHLRVHDRLGPLTLGAGTYVVDHPLRGSVLRLKVTATAVTAADAGVPSPAAVPATVLGAAQQGTAEAAALADGTPVFVVGHGDRTGVVGARASHDPLGVASLVVWCSPRREFTEVLYGSRYDSAGGYVGGPAPWGLVPYDVTDGGGTVEVTAALAPTPRHVQRPTWALRPQGPECPNDRDGELLADFVVRHEPEDWSRSSLDDLADGWSRVEAAVIVTGPQAGALCGELTSTGPPACPDSAVKVPGVGAPPERAGDDLPSALAGPLLVRADDGRPVAVVRLPGVEQVGEPFGQAPPEGWMVGYLSGADPTGDSDPGLCHEGCPAPYVSLATGTVVTAPGDIHSGTFDDPPPDDLRLADVLAGGGGFGGAFLQVAGDLDVVGTDRLRTGMSMTDLAALDLATDPAFVHVELEDGTVTRIEEHPRPVPPG